MRQQLTAAPGAPPLTAVPAVEEPARTAVAGRPWPVDRWLTLLAAGTVALVTASLVLTLADPAFLRRAGLHLWVDAVDEPSLPTWWATTVLTLAAMAYGVTGLAARTGGHRSARAWFVLTGVFALCSLAEHSALPERSDDLLRQLFPDGPGSWLPVAALAGGAVLLVVLGCARHLDPRAAGPVRAGVVLLVGSALTSGAATDGLGDPESVRVADHLGEIGEGLGAMLLLLAVSRSVTVVRTTTGLRIVGPHDPDVVGAGLPRMRPVWAVLLGSTALLGALSLAVVQYADRLGPRWQETRSYVDVLLETNLPTWWSTALLGAAAAAHLLAGIVGRGGEVVGAGYWFGTAAILAGLSLDDHTQLHERSEELGRVFADRDGDYPFYWLIPGAAAGLTVTAVVVLLAMQVPARARMLLLTGIGLLFTCALGLESVQGWFMAEQNEGTGFRLTYHVEEVGENVGALLLLAAAAGVLKVTRDAHGLVLRPASPRYDGSRGESGGRRGAEAGDPGPAGPGDRARPAAPRLHRSERRPAGQALRARGGRLGGRRRPAPDRG